MQIIHIEQESDRAADEQVIGLPTLLRLAPASVRRVTRDLTDEAGIMAALNLRSSTHD